MKKRELASGAQQSAVTALAFSEISVPTCRCFPLELRQSETGQLVCANLDCGAPLIRRRRCA